MKFKTQLMDEVAISRAVMRLSYEIIERGGEMENTLLVGIKTRGVPLAEMIRENVKKNAGVSLSVYELDITHYRDDKKSEVKVKIPPALPVEGKDVILVDDVLFTGRTARAAIDAVLEAGRAASIKLAVLVDRGHRELPIRADYVGKNVPTSTREQIIVRLKSTDGEAGVSIYET